jgi:hypothetical protein
MPRHFQNDIYAFANAFMAALMHDHALMLSVAATALHAITLSRELRK